MHRGKTSPLFVLAVWLSFALTTSACDLDPGSGGWAAQDLQAASEQLEPGQADLAAPALDPLVEDLLITAGAELPTPANLLASLEVFVFPTSEAIAVTGPSTGLLAPFPAGVEPFDEPEIAEGLLIAAKVRDFYDNLIGFGTEQEVLDAVNALGDSTFTLTLPERGTLMLGQTEDFSVPFAEVDDMIANNELVRSYDPPLVFVTTVPGAGTVIGGTDEFAGAQGFMIEVDLVNEIDLINRRLDVDAVLIVGRY